jgi:hypothetical protein
MSYIILSGRCCDIIVLDVHAPTRDTIYVKDSFYKDLDRIFDKFPKYRYKNTEERKTKSALTAQNSINKTMTCWKICVQFWNQLFSIKIM